MKTDWKRKNTFVRELRALLKRFRIVEMKTDVALEATDAVPTALVGNPGQAGLPLVTERRYEPTGRVLVNIRLVGFWRSPK